MGAIERAFDQGRDELAQALKAFPDSIGPSMAQSVEEPQIEQPQPEMPQEREIEL